MVSIDEEETDVLLGEDNEAELDLGNYDLTLYPNPSKLIVIPNFESDDFKLVDETQVQAQLKVLYPYDYDTSDQKIKFTITSGDAYFPEGETEKEIIVFTEDKAGNCYFNLKAKTDVQEIKNITIHAEVYAKSDPDIVIYEKDLSIPITDNLEWQETFDNWPAGYDYLTTLSGEWNFHSGYSEETKISGPGANNTLQALRLYCPTSVDTINPCLLHSSSSLSRITFAHTNPATDLEVRFYLRNEMVSLEPRPGDCTNGIPGRIRGFVSFCARWGLFICRDDDQHTVITYDPNDPNDPDDDIIISIGKYIPGGWNYIKMQVTTNSEGVTHITYWINGTKVKTITDIFETNFPHFTMNTAGGPVWYDEIKVYNLKGLPFKTQ